MKTLQKIGFYLLVLTIIISCSKNNDETSSATNCANECSHTITNGETASTVPSSLDGSYELTYHAAQTGSPYTNGTKASFTLSNNTLTIDVDGKCITLKNPFRNSGGVQDIFTDDCDKNAQYHISTLTDGSFNEMNVFGTDGTWLGQFAKL